VREQVRMWRAPGEDRVLLMAGYTTGYAVEPRGDYVFGLVEGAPMRSRRGGEHRVVEPGQVVAWDPSAPHVGAAVEGRAWFSRLIVVSAVDLAALAGDVESVLPADVGFAEPVVGDPGLARGFLRMHRAFEEPGGERLVRDELLSGWLRAVVGAGGSRRPGAPLGVRDDRALRVAGEYLAAHVDRNVGLDELAAVAGVGKFRLVRLFRERLGRPPHAVALAHRIHRARRLLEQGEPIAGIAAATGFADQSHLHRHFRRSLGLSPGEYRRRFGTGRLRG
jgi:AraC-like DNA-binding protein